MLHVCERNEKHGGDESGTDFCACVSGNKQHWITILLDGSVSEAKTLDFLDMSYDLIDGAGRKEEK